MSEVNPLLDFAGQAGNQLGYAERLHAYVQTLLAAPKQHLLNLCQSRKQLHQQFWNNPQFPVQSIVKDMGLETVVGYFELDSEYAAFLRKQLIAGGVKDADLDNLVPLVPEQWQVDYSATTAADLIKAK